MDDQQNLAPEASDEDVMEVDEATTSEATETTEGQDDSQPAEGDEKPEDKQTASKARRERRKAMLEELRASEAAAKRKVSEYEAQQQRIKRAAESSKPPQQDDFQDYNEFLMAAGAFRAAQEIDARQSRDIDDQIKASQAELQTVEQQRQLEVAQAWGEQVAEAKTRYADFDAVAHNPQLPITETMQSVILASDLGADLAYYLGQNPQEAAQIARMEPLDAARTMGAIEARLSRPKPKTISNAPEPVTPVRGKASSGSKDPSKMSSAEYRAWRAKGGTP